MSSITSSSIEATSPTEDWAYVAEGGANLVLSYVGASAVFNGKLLRLRKRSFPIPNDGHTSNPRDVSVEFGDKIIRPLLGQQYVVEMHRHVVSTRWLMELKEYLEKARIRPQFRRNVDDIDCESGVVVLAQDLVHGKGVLAVEIKPKWGFLPSSKHLSLSTRDIKASFCRFCMHRYHKNIDKVFPLELHETGYCPLDLYSQDETRVLKAIESLVRATIDSGGSANNMRIFYEGKMIDLASAQDRQDLLSFLHATAPSESSEDLENLFARSMTTCLMDSLLLSRLQYLQSSLDSIDIEGLSALMKSESGVDLSLPSPDVSKLGSQPSLEEWGLWLSTRSTSTDLRSHILSYLLSATFKDCSIFLRISQSSTTAGLDCVTKAIDLDPKPIIRLSKYWKMDQEIVKSWKTMFESLADSERERLRRCRP